MNQKNVKLTKRQKKEIARISCAMIVRSKCSFDMEDINISEEDIQEIFKFIDQHYKKLIKEDPDFFTQDDLIEYVLNKY